MMWVLRPVAEIEPRMLAQKQRLVRHAYAIYEINETRRGGCASDVGVAGSGNSGETLGRTSCGMRHASRREAFITIRADAGRTAVAPMRENRAFQTRSRGTRSRATIESQPIANQADIAVIQSNAQRFLEFGSMACLLKFKRWA
jgi:hypothetical protein